MPRNDALASVLGCVACVACLGCRVVVLSDLDEAQAGEAVLALDAVHIAAYAARETGGDGSGPAFRVEVPRTDLAQALSALRAARLPREEPAGLDALERTAGLLATPEEELGRLEAARAAELSRSLSRLPGVLEARVHAARATSRSALDHEARPASAGVLLLRAHGAPPIAEDAVRALVAASLPDIRPEAVSVLQAEAPRVPARAGRMVAVGPLSVARESAGTLRAWLAGILLVNVLLATALIVAVARKRATERGHS
jgi:type III secretion protein J